MVTSDVLEWPIPPDLSIVYLYCPFTDELFARALERLFESWDERPRPLHIVYNYPWEHNRLLASGRTRVVDVRASRWPAPPRWWLRPEVIVTYEVTGPNGRSTDAHDRHGGGTGSEPALERWNAPNDTRFKLERGGRHVASAGSLIRAPARRPSVGVASSGGKPTRVRNVPLPPPAQGQPRGLVPVGRGGAGPSA